MMDFLAQLDHHLLQHGVVLQSGPWGESLSAAGTTADTSADSLVPVFGDALHAEVMPT